jgi:multisubunit Na+/H+ antiporter MnhB subunit
MKLYEIIILSIVGICVLYAYYIYLRNPPDSDKNTNYFTSYYWFGMNENLVKIITFFQIFAIIGFLVAVISWIKTPPKGGIMDKYLFITIFIFLLSALIWPYAVNKKIHWLVVFSLIITAISSILMLAGSIEEDNPRTIIVVGLLFLCIITVLGDAVLWNANYIKKQI